MKLEVTIRPNVSIEGNRLRLTSIQNSEGRIDVVRMNDKLTGGVVNYEIDCIDEVIAILMRYQSETNE